MCINGSFPRTGLSLGPKLMHTQHKVLLMEMLFLGSMVMVIIVTNLAWEPVSQDLYPWWHSSSVSRPEKFAQNPFSLVNLVTQLSQDVCLWKGFGGTCTTLKCSFYLFSATSLEVYKPCLSLWGRYSPASFPCQSLAHFFFLISLFRLIGG